MSAPSSDAGRVAAADRVPATFSGRASVRPRRRPGENRSRLLEAGLIEFGWRGFRGAATATIAEIAGVPQPHVYANFSSKGALFLACAERARERLRVASQGAFTGPHPDAHGASLRKRSAVTGSDEPRASDDEPRASDDDLARFLLQLVSACGDAEVGEQVSTVLRELRRELGGEGLRDAVARGAELMLRPERR